MKIGLFVSVLVAVSTGCPQSGPGPVSPPVDAESGPGWNYPDSGPDSGLDPGQLADLTCAAACTNLAQIGCPQLADCTTVLQQDQDGHLIRARSGYLFTCAAAAQVNTLDEARNVGATCLVSRGPADSGPADSK